MNTIKKIILCFALLLLVVATVVAGVGKVAASALDNDSLIAEKALDIEAPESSIIDEVVWVVGDEAILKSDIEAMRLQAEVEGIKFKGNPDCAIPEQIALQKLYLHQAVLDSVEVTEAEIAQGVEQQINYWINMVGSKEKLEEYRKMTITQLRDQMHDEFKNQRLVQQMKQKLVENVSVTPQDVRMYFKDMPEDSIPFIPTEVEVEIITHQPRTSQAEINRIKETLRDYTERVTSGRSSFATLARLYSEDPGSARQGGELGYMGRGVLDPAFATVAFNLTDPKKISKVVESEFGFHIIQLVDRRGDKVNCRHILLKPRVSDAELDSAVIKLDSLAADIRRGKVTFEDIVPYASDDKDTKNNRGVMVNNTENGRTSRFQMKDLPSEVASAVENLKVGEISPAFVMVNDKGKKQVAIVKLKNRIDGHKATITEDFQVLKEIVLQKQQEKVLHDWVVEKIKKTYVRMKERYKSCDFEYEGWVK